ncbi:MAG: rRNA maturation RNase YbeY [Oscillospiraceae bacterium]|nr:rRNA maturation RNase YbeY [Oscillospiraceae bacterium]
MHNIYIEFTDYEMADESIANVVEQAVLATLRYEDVDVSCCVSILVAEDGGIQGYNLKFRGIDAATDVLSFPMQEFHDAGWENHGDLDYDENMSELPLGDIVVSAESVKRQAGEYENTVEYELAYLVIHSTLHLLGYDHDNDDNEKIMHQHTKNIIQEMDEYKFE